jgi:hypothetical protein
VRLQRLHVFVAPFVSVQTFASRSAQIVIFYVFCFFKPFFVVLLLSFCVQTSPLFCAQTAAFTVACKLLHPHSAQTWRGCCICIGMGGSMWIWTTKPGPTTLQAIPRPQRVRLAFILPLFVFSFLFFSFFLSPLAFSLASFVVPCFSSLLFSSLLSMFVSASLLTHPQRPTIFLSLGPLSLLSPLSSLSLSLPSLSRTLTLTRCLFV